MVSLPLSLGLTVTGMSMAAAAGVARGCADFAFSALSVAGLALPVSPASVVPANFILEVLASWSLLPSAARDVDWPCAGARARATKIVQFLFTDPCALGWALWLAPPKLGRIWGGQRSFAGVSIHHFGPQVATAVTLVSLLTILRPLRDLLGCTTKAAAPPCPLSCRHRIDTICRRIA